jgi:hypothetical protein
MNTHAFIAIAAAFALAGCGRHPIAAHPGQPPSSGQTSAPVGRYQAVAIARTPGSEFDSVLIVDTRDGHLWQWVGSPTAGPQAVRYMGQVTPSGHMGDIIEQKKGN